ncbi:MAG TPA: hypothetical protein VM888_11330 [Chitinophagaceae bacterium]|jgi:hypothetical protein|nr:hypothetical protein [Chitinophagaceae bacterium]
MGHFTISLPHRRQGAVSTGKVIKIQKGLLGLLPWNKFKREERIGYIIKVEPPLHGRCEFHVFKSKEGKWLQEGKDDLPFAKSKLRKEEEEITLAIKKAIDDHEKNSMKH